MFCIPQGHVAIMEKFGQFSHIQEPGLNIYNPVFYGVKETSSWGNIANKNHYLIETSEQQTNTPSRRCQTKDNVTIKANSSLCWKIIDPKKAVYSVDNLPTALSDIVLNALRANIGTLTFNEVFSSRNIINEKILDEVSTSVNKWGIELIRVEIQELGYSEATEQAMMKEMIAEREKKAKILTAEGESSSKQMQAKANADAILLNAQAKAKAIECLALADRKYLHELAQEVGPEQAANLLEAQKYKESMQVISENPSHKIFLPQNTNTQLHI